MIELSDEIAAHLGTGEEVFDCLFALTGERFRFHEGRETLRVEIGGQHYFLKRHHGYGWRRLFRSLVSGRIPVVSARVENNAVRMMWQAGIPATEVVGFGERGRNPATKQSFLLMRELAGCQDLDTLCRKWSSSPPSARFRQKVVQAVAFTARKLHGAGINHRDFYLAHLWLDAASAGTDNLRLHVIDLHRAMKHRRQVPWYWVAKDMSSLLLSAWNCGLTKTDCLRFLAHYRGRSIREVLRDERSLWEHVIWRARRFFRREFQCDPPFEFQAGPQPSVVESSQKFAA